MSCARSTCTGVLHCTCQSSSFVWLDVVGSAVSCCVGHTWITGSDSSAPFHPYLTLPLGFAVPFCLLTPITHITCSSTETEHTPPSQPSDTTLARARLARVTPLISAETTKGTTRTDREPDRFGTRKYLATPPFQPTSRFLLSALSLLAHATQQPAASHTVLFTRITNQPGHRPYEILLDLVLGFAPFADHPQPKPNVQTPEPDPLFALFSSSVAILSTSQTKIRQRPSTRTFSRPFIVHG